jgi:hypothetical protein
MGQAARKSGFFIFRGELNFIEKRTLICADDADFQRKNLRNLRNLWIFRKIGD